MSYEFFDDFSFHDEAGKPYNILIEKNSDLEHLHATVKDEAYHVLVVGNKHFAHTPPLKDFKLELNLNIVTPCFEVSDEIHKAGLRVFFRYDRFRKEGYALECAVTNNSFSLDLAFLNSKNEKVHLKKLEAPFNSPINHSDFNVILEVNENKIIFTLNGVRLEIVDENHVFPKAGHIGLDKTFYHGELIVREWRISSADAIGRSKIMGPLTFNLPCEHGMSVPFSYTLAAYKYESGPYELDIKLSGGIKDRPDRGKSAGQWCHEMDMMKTPYIRIDSPAGEFKNIVLYNGLMTLLDREEKRVWVVDKYGDVAWPLKRRICLESLPDIQSLTFAAGYAHYLNEPKRFLAGGPFEVLCESQGKVLHQGQPLRRGEVALAVRSPEDKLICALIPEAIPDRERALRHARTNHYFFEEEQVRFQIAIRYHTDLFFAEEFKLGACLQSVYGDVMGNEVVIEANTSNQLGDKELRERCGVDVLSYDAVIATPMKTGVYHLAVGLSLGGKAMRDETVIFEVMSRDPDAVPPPVASGLPVLFSDTSETKYLETDAFDPLCERAGAMHYFSVCRFRLDHAKRERIWELSGFYKRKLYVGLTSREANGDLSIESNREVIAHCDYVQCHFENSRFGRYDLWKCDAYKDEVMGVLIAFIKSSPVALASNRLLTPERLDEVKANGNGLSEEMFVELVAHCWKEWLAYFSVWFAAMLKRQRDQLKGINKDVERTAGGPFPIYASHNKSAYFMNCFGYNPRGGAEKFFDGFWQFEDYPEACGYSVTRAIFPFMSMKLSYPAWRIFPEIYAALIDGCNDGAVSQAHPPFGFYEYPAAMIKERVYEYAFAAAWFTGKRFHYWKDHGFHFNARHGKDGFQALLGAWGNVVKHIPVAPVKTTCFLADWRLIEQHPDYYEKNCNTHAQWKDVINTAEEALAYSYNAARNTGIPAGFVTSLEDLKDVRADMADLLVLPPLNKDVPREHIETIRKLHQSGVSLLGFENVHGLEDLFGVKPLGKTVRVRQIGVSPGHGAQIGVSAIEFVEHEQCKACYGSDGATVVLAGAEHAEGAMDIPVLLTNTTTWGKTAFFNVPPTVVKRDSFVERIGYGQECVSVVIEKAMSYIMKQLSTPCVCSQGAKVIAFQDDKGDFIIIVEEESPTYSNTNKYPRAFLLNLMLSGVGESDIICDKDYSVASGKPGNVVLRLFLGKYESAVFNVRPVFTKRRKTNGMNSDHKKSCATHNKSKGISKS